MQRRARNSGGFGRQPGGDARPGEVSEAMLRHARKSGQLNLSNRGLTKVPQKVWRVNLDVPPEAQNVSLDSTDDDKWWEIVDLTKLILASNKLSEISSEIAQFPALLVLDIHDNVVSSLPDEVGQLVNLKRLNLSSVMLDSHCTLASSMITCLQLYTATDLSYNSLSSLPASLGSCQSLRYLNLAQNYLEFLPSEIGSLNALKDLNLGNNKFRELPKELGKLHNLERLDCRHNNLSDVPFLKSCQALKIVFVTCAQCKSLHEQVSLFIVPDEITVLKNLERLDLANNEISGLPYAMGTMESLKSLVLDGNPLRSLRRDVVLRGTQAVLKHLRSRIPQEEKSDSTDAPVASTPVSSPLPTASSGLDLHTIASTKALNFSNKKLSSIPDEVWDAAVTGGVSTLNISKNVLTEVPARLLSLERCLTDLNMSMNRLGSLPAEFSCLIYRTQSRLVGSCFHSVSCFCSINQLTDLPDSLSSLKALREINISNNRFKTLPTVLYSLKSLEIILASGNQIQLIEVDKLLLMSVLSTLDLQNNDLAQVPPQLGNATQLR
ncbi:PREDICTED: LOW QUALITY PROTEIN: leucine-rich repeat-containing protein 40-like [Acropora digitifera]|uniref:LOW QUALITY PROTEIN: leucine-rich repeat-containing protein 40-like n=1 Tax=Acropora digitifera TaxID=70779 RepID=UPI00077A42FF|nr:PREDICTED: LOW QUALITY PROTEIN: leucine-rich repeat-containing protein 40-like [Acropora digitifera]